MEVLDGPTFAAAEGWDWIPGIRDRNTGIWQDVTLTATGPVEIGDLNVITTLPKPDRSEADIEIEAPLTNTASAPIDGELTATFDDVKVTKHVHLAPGETVSSAGARGVCAAQGPASAAVVAEWIRRSRAAHTQGDVRHRRKRRAPRETNRIRDERSELRALALRRNGPSATRGGAAQPHARRGAAADRRNSRRHPARSTTRRRIWCCPGKRCRTGCAHSHVGADAGAGR